VISYLPTVDSASPAADVPPGAPVPEVPPTSMVAFRAADLQVRWKASEGRAGVALAAASAGTGVAAGTLMTFCHPVVTVPAVVRRDGTVQAGGWLPDFVRLGELERHAGDGVIEGLAEAAAADGRVPAPERRRLMSVPLVMRLTVAMTLMPESGYAEVARQLAGHLADVPWAREWHVPAPKVFTAWRDKAGPALMEELFWRVAGPLIEDDAPSAVSLAGMPVCGIDGMLVAVADTPASRAAFGCAGTKTRKGYGEAPFPQIQTVVVSARAGRAKLGAIMGAARAGEQTLLARLIARRPELFAGRVFCFDRNFPGHKIITAILDVGGHVVARVKAGIALPATPGGWLSDGSRLSYLNAPDGKKAGRLPVRVVEHNAVLPCADGEQVSETCTLATTLLDHTAATAEQVREAYLARWPASETTFGQDKATITGAGDRTCGPVLRSGTPRLVVQEFWAWMCGTQLVRASTAAALTSAAAAARALRRRTQAPVTADELSFTTGWHSAIRSMTQSRVTATTPLPELAALADTTARAMLHTLNTTGRQRHSVREQKHRPRFGHTVSTKKTVTGIPEITRFALDST
jgi:Insertion element 4 transposase N-terminal